MSQELEQKIMKTVYFHLNSIIDNLRIIESRIEKLEAKK